MLLDSIPVLAYNNEYYSFICMSSSMARTADPHRRADILQAARAAFEQHGYTQTRIADIATRAGVAPGTIYLYFESKEAIVLALAEQFFTGLAAATLPKIDQPDGVAAIAEAVQAGLAYATQELALLKLTLLDAGLNTLEPLAARQSFTKALATHLAARMQAGTLRHYDAFILAELISGMIVRAVEACVLYGRDDLSLYERTLTELLHHALLPAEENRKS